MHDIGRTQLESEFGVHEGEHFEFGHEGEFYYEGESPFGEAEETELAAELLGVTTEAELDRFLGSLISKAGKAVGSFVRSPVGRALGGQLKGLAKQALPMVGKAIGGYIGGPTGGDIGGRLAGAAGRWFGLELEGLSLEDREFEVAKQFVRLAGAACKNAAATSPAVPPQAAAQAALTKAAQQFAPGLVSGAAGAPGAVAGGGKTGRWVRKGNVIMVLGV
ncbi:MAG TPA: hypothetical protein VJH03_02035 [Blastocatellia bacterium]|nr:hypothetical protein [Blastocatellia bacterium]